VPILWLFEELMDEYTRTDSVDLIVEFFACVDGQDRELLAHLLFWQAMPRADWRLAALCVRNCYRMDLDLNGESGEGDLHCAMSHLGDCPDVVEWLLKHGAQVDLRNDSCHMTPLMTAALKGYVNIVALLLAHGADINASTHIDDDDTALMLAAYMGSERIVKQLLEHGVDIQHRGVYGQTALTLAEVNGHVEIARLLR